MNTPICTLDPTDYFRDWTFVGGVGNYAEHQACVMSAIVALRRAEAGVDLNGAIDTADCVCPVARRLAIRRNDVMPDADRKAWALGMIPRLMGSKVSPAVTRARGFACADYACRVITPEWLDKAKREAEAVECRALAPIIDVPTARAAQKVMQRIRTAAAYAAAAADAAADADADADADAYAAAAADDAAAAAYAAAYAAAAADAAADADAAAYAADADADADAYAAAYAAAADARGIQLRHLDGLLDRVLAITEAK